MLLCLQPPPIDPALAAAYIAELPRTGPPSRLYGHGGDCFSIGLPQPGTSLHAVAVRTRRAVLGRAEAYLRANGSLPACIHLDTSNTMLRVRLDK